MIFFAWFPYFFKILLGLREVAFHDRVLKVLSIITWALVWAILLNMSYVIPLAVSGIKIHWFFEGLIQVLSVIVMFGIMGVYSVRYYNTNSINKRWVNACIETQFLLINPKTGKKEDIPRLVGKHPDRLIVQSRSYTAQEFENIADKLAGAMGVHINMVTPLISAGEVRQGFVEIWYSMKDLPFNIPFKNVPINRGWLVFGYGISGWVKMPLRKIVHMLVFGMSGQGKTVFQRILLLQAYISNPESTFILFDFKMKQEFGAYDGIKNAVVIDNHEEAIAVMKLVHGEYAYRSGEIVKNRAEHAADLGFPPIFIIIDEVSEALVGHKDDFKGNGKSFPSWAKQFAQMLTSGSKLYRSSNIFIFAGAQRLDAEAAPTQFRDNLKVRVAFKTGSAETSKMVLIYAHAFKLPAIPGRMMLWDMESGKYHKAQVPFIEKDQAAQLLEKHSADRGETRLYNAMLEALQGVKEKQEERRKKRKAKSDQKKQKAQA